MRLGGETIMAETGDISRAQLRGLEVLLRTLIASHPDPQRLREAFRNEYWATKGSLLLEGASPECIDAYQEFLGGMLPDLPTGCDLTEESSG